MRTTTIRKGMLAVATLVAVSVALAATLGASAMPGRSSSDARAFALGQSLAGGAYWAHGVFHDPPVIAARTSRLNDALDACYTSHGATRVSIGTQVSSAGGGWTYKDPHGIAQAACQSQQDAVTAFAGGPEMAGEGQATQPLMDGFWSCMSSRGLSQANPNADDSHFHVDTQSHAFKAGTAACSAAANSKFGVSVP